MLHLPFQITALICPSESLKVKYVCPLGIASIELFHQLLLDFEIFDHV